MVERDVGVATTTPESNPAAAAAPVRALAPPERLLALQRSVGNRAVAQMIAAGRLAPEREDLDEEVPVAGKRTRGGKRTRHRAQQKVANEQLRAAAKAAGPGSMSIENVTGPDVGDCGEFSWQVNFKLPKPSPAGGWFVQEVNVQRAATDCTGAPDTANSHGSHYWEAWHVAPGGTEDELVAAGTFNFADQYSMPASADGTSGTCSYTGRVKFHEGLTLPSTFIPNNPATFAQDLPSTTINPHLPGGTRALAHSIAGRWDCCPAGTANATTITSRTP